MARKLKPDSETVMIGPDDEAVTAAKWAGVTAGYAGEQKGTNPYAAEHPLHAVWNSGWLGGQRQRAVEMKSKGAKAEPEHASV